MAPPLNSVLESVTTEARFNVGPGSNPPANGPDPTKGDVAGVWGFVGTLVLGPSQVSSPPTNCGVFGQTLGSPDVLVLALAARAPDRDQRSVCGVWGGFQLAAMAFLAPAPATTELKRGDNVSEQSWSFRAKQQCFPLHRSLRFER